MAGSVTGSPAKRGSTRFLVVESVFSALLLEAAGIALLYFANLLPRLDDSHMLILMRRLLLAVLLAGALSAAAAVDVREFSSPEKRQRYLQLVEELRCPKCQNQNLAGSDSPIAHDLRRELYRLLEEGKTDTEIRSFMVERYGDYVLYRPPVQKNTLLLWWGPPVVLGIGLLILVILVWRRSRLLRENSASQDLSPEEQARLNQLMEEEQRMAAPESKPSNPGGES
jgi:cytochrome c-type biogenesis protein CcmH